MPITVQDLIDRARIQHWSFADNQVGDGAALLFLSDLQRLFILEQGTAIEGLINTTVQLATQISGSLVGVDANGNPQYTTTYQDGWPVQQNANGTPYVDFSQALKIAGDPFGQNGGTIGWPLPADFLKLLAVTLVLSDNSIRECRGIMERDRTQYVNLPGFKAFISGDRLVPVQAYTTGSLNSGDLWSQVTAVQLSYVGVADFAALGDAVTVPRVLVTALIAGLAWFFARQAPKLSPVEKQSFKADYEEAVAALGILGVDLVNEVVSTSVKYRG